jgi:hypothetical protein
MTKATSFIISNSTTKNNMQLVECQLFLPTSVEAVELSNSEQSTIESTESRYIKMYFPDDYTYQDVLNTLVDLGELELTNNTGK